MYRLVLFIVFVFSLADAQDTVHLKNGQSQKGNLVSQTDEALSFSFEKSTGTSTVTIPWKSIAKIEFTSSLKQIEALGNPTNTHLKIFADLWETSSPWIKRPNSQAAEIGINYAKKLALSDKKRIQENALTILKTISTQAWDPEKQTEALRVRLETLLALGRERDAIRVAEDLTEVTENPAHLIESKMVLARNAFERLKEIEKENPRWYLDDEVRPERLRYFNTAIDHSLFAYLFYGSEEKYAAQGLFHAAQIYRYASDLENSKLCAEDILKLYSETAIVPLAKKHLNKISTLEKE